MSQTTSDKTATIFDWFSDFEKANLILCFKGDFSQDLVNSILMLAETKQEYHDNKTLVRSRVFSVLVELMQNICKYGAASGNSGELKPGIVLVGRAENHFYIKTGNLLFNSGIPALEEHLNKLKKMNREELKAMHKKILANTSLHAQSGAGLGLVAIARKSEKISFEFKKVNNELSFFGIESTVSSNPGE